MNKTLFLFLSFILLTSSCQKKSDSQSQEKAAAINTISVIIDEQLWNGEVGDSIRNKFASPVLGLPQEEPLFTIKQFPVKLFEGFSTGSRNMIIVKKENKGEYKIVKNEFSTPQNSFHISGRNTSQIISILEEHASEIINRMKQTEIEAYQKTLLDSILSAKKIKTKFSIDITVPANYDYAQTSKNFVWLKKEITSGNTSLLIYQVPYNSIGSKQVVNSIVKIRDSIGNKFIHGRPRNSMMITEEAYFPYFSKVKLNGFDAFETKGTWQMKNDFMSGPFINYAIKDKANNRILILEGFCYAPSKTKRDLMFELEAIIKSLKILKK
ncbi:DUF4837 family protein [Flavobacterium capsici]|uniref:DUF4837 family protein n=1 Tax=Flavobacterium capsici TaxID=3075618 RepID=A0AA96EZI1_9FLAO|nr:MULTISPECIES: DUF4837 family protein [unclassified Flavobacterium]WNM19633.1 DUF4837 family protein [Flavobacterium sp. PMR2A8]WNM21022.1 DUF4837 family protein [Flavobacterium sp. PMTSA4]